MIELDDILSQLDGVFSSNNEQYSSRCPVHKGKKKNFRVKIKDGRIFLHCLAGCEIGEILKVLGLKRTQDLEINPSEWKPRDKFSPEIISGFVDLHRPRPEGIYRETLIRKTREYFILRETIRRFRLGRFRF